MENLHNSNEIQKRVTLYFDNELGETERKELLQQVDLDPKCSKIFNKEKSFREFIRNNVQRPTVTSDFIQGIKAKIKHF